jgi:hypothetical protein
MRTIISLGIIVLAASLCVSAQVENGDTARVTISSPQVKPDKWPGGTIRVEHIDNAKKHREGIDRHLSGHSDVLILEPVMVPWASCDSLVECAVAVNEVCEALGSEGEEATLQDNEGQGQTCEGTCGNGHSVTVVCVH